MSMNSEMNLTRWADVGNHVRRLSTLVQSLDEVIPLPPKRRGSFFKEMFFTWPRLKDREK